jgi:hypothetical protein
MTNPYRAMCAELVNELTRAANGLSNRTALAAHINDNHRALWAKDAYQAAARARALLAQPMAEAPAEALAARPLLEQVAAMADCIGAHTVGQITAISDRAAAWLRENPPGQPVAIEPRGCPLPGACSCVEPAPVAVSERLPRPEDCTEGRCWVFYRFFGFAPGHWRNHWGKTESTLATPTGSPSTPYPPLRLSRDYAPIPRRALEALDD